MTSPDTRLTPQLEYITVLVLSHIYKCVAPVVQYIRRRESTFRCSGWVS